MTFNSLWAGQQILGARKVQQDAFRIVEPDAEGNPVLFVLADGMGGHKAGDIAATLAVDIFCNYAGPVPQLGFLDALDKANRAIGQEAQDDPEKSDMGCTLVAVQFDGADAYWISVGDSPLYLVSNGRVKRLNANHSMASILDGQARRGEISFEEARNSRSRSALLSALTGDPVSRIDRPLHPISVDQDDWLIIGSDGIDTLTPEQLGQVVQQVSSRGAEAVCSSILDAINRAGLASQDNATVIAVRGWKALRETERQGDDVRTRPIPVR